MKYYEEIAVVPDELQGGIGRVEVANVKISAAVERGDLLCSASLSGVFAKVSSASDASKVLAIAAKTSDGEVTQAYVGGEFNREKIKAGGLSLTLFEDEMRKQNIHLRKLEG